MAALWRLPVLFACENNQYAMGTALAREHAATDLALRAASYGMPAWPVDGMDVLAVVGAAQRAVETIRGGGGPCFLELRTYRFRAHSLYDADRYRDKAEIGQWVERDPIPSLFAELCASGELRTDDLGRMEADVDREIEAAVATAESAPFESIGDLTRYVYTERS